MAAPTPILEVPYDEVCKLPDPDPRFVRLVYYDPSGDHTFEKRLPIAADMAGQQLDLLREGRIWYFSERSKRLKLIPRHP